MNYINWAKKYYCTPWLSSEETIHKIINAIKNDIPFSYTRFGDGDLIMLKEYFSLIQNNDYYVNMCNADNHIISNHVTKDPEHTKLRFYAKAWQKQMINEHLNDRWGVNDESIKYDIINTIGKNNIFAIQNSTCLGIWDIVKDILYNTEADFYQFRHSYIPHIELFVDAGADFKSLCDGHIVKTNETIANPFKFKELLNGKPIHIFTSNEYELNNITKLHEILETEITYTNISPKRGDWTTFSFSHTQLLHEECKKIKSQIVLYGLGYGAKHIPSYLAKHYNKTVIDVGSLLDGWSGIVSRPFINNLDFIVPGNVPKRDVDWIP